MDGKWIHNGQQVETPMPVKQEKENYVNSIGLPFQKNKQMDLPHFNSLPEWEPRLHKTDSGEAWKWQEELQIAEAMYNQWREVFALVMAFVETLPEEENDPVSTKNLIYQNAYIVAPKIVSACGDTLYQIKMENAALIRFNCRQMWEQIAFAALTGTADEEHKKVIEEALGTFRQLFRRWVGTFKKDEFEDDWGLF
jgi:hypothetical protein